MFERCTKTKYSIEILPKHSINKEESAKTSAIENTGP
jgi:hypothetical protein